MIQADSNELLGLKGLTPVTRMVQASDPTEIVPKISK